MKNDRKRGRIRGFGDVNPNESYVSGGPERIRTSDARFRKPTLYPLSYGAVLILHSALGG
jgi:hypothetical protein